MRRPTPRDSASARSRQSLAVCLAMAMGIGATSPAEAYLKFGTVVGNRQVTLRWNRMPIRYYVTDLGAAGVTPSQFQTAIDQSFSTWTSVATATLSAQDVGVTSAPPSRGDGMTVLGFQSRPDLDRVLGSTSFVVDTQTGDLIEADILFNTTFPWSVAAQGERGRYDLQSIATHEIGHLLGLGHSALGETEVIPGGRRVIAAETTLFPIAYSAGSIDDRVLRADDIAGIGDVYPGAGFGDKGSINGKVTKNGSGVFGAHVEAYQTATGKIVGGFSLGSDGSFGIAGLDAGVYLLRVEPLDDAETSSFFDPTGPVVDLGFRATYLEQLVIVPKGGGAAPVEIKVVPR
jgi:hypothetical protein